MNDDQHPALSLEDETPPGLVLVLPAELGEVGLLRGVVEAVQEVRNTLAHRVTLFQTAAEQAHADGDSLRQATCRGQVLACSTAAAYIEESIVKAFDLWEQYEPGATRPDARGR